MPSFRAVQRVIAGFNSILIIKCQLELATFAQISIRRFSLSDPIVEVLLLGAPRSKRFTFCQRSL